MSTCTFADRRSHGRRDPAAVERLFQPLKRQMGKLRHFLAARQRLRLNVKLLRRVSSRSAAANSVSLTDLAPKMLPIDRLRG
jgi:hypothetical protein